MAVELKKFQAEYKTIQSAIAAAFGDRKTVGDSEGNTKKVLDGARLAIGDRAGALRGQGHLGKTLAEFATDPEIKAAVETAKTSLANYKAMEARKLKAHAAIKQIHANLLDLANRMDKEIADRKKKLFEPKSLPDMVKLAKEVRDEIGEEGGLKDETIQSIATGPAPKAGAVEAAYWPTVELELKKSASLRANASEVEAAEKFKPRLIKLRGDKAIALGKEAETAAAAALSKFKAKDVPGAKTEVKTAVDKSLELNKIVEEYSAAYNKNKSFLQQNPDHDAMFKFVTNLTSLNNRVLKNVQTAQSTVK
jgi:hypothetical protein